MSLRVRGLSSKNRFAALAWDALAPCAVLEAVVGSRAWGLADEGSDTDLRGVFVVPFAWTAGLAAFPEDLASADATAAMWEVGKTVRQALRADPNTLELLFVDGVRALDPMGAWLLEARDAFVSAEIYGSFGRYALSQLGKLRQSLRRSHRLDGGVAASGDGDALHDAAEPHSWDAGEVRPKDAYNLLRVLHSAIGWLETGAPSFIPAEPVRARLLAVKRGDVPLEQVLDEAETLAPTLEAARATTRLPRRADLPRADDVLRRIRSEAARRFTAAAPGPWGAGAHPPPMIVWETP